MSSIYVIKNKDGHYMNSSYYFCEEFARAKTWANVAYARAALTRLIKYYTRRSGVQNAVIYKIVIDEEKPVPEDYVEPKNIKKHPTNMSIDELKNSVYEMNCLREDLRERLKAVNWEYWSQKILLEDKMKEAEENPKKKEEEEESTPKWGKILRSF